MNNKDRLHLYMQLEKTILDKIVSGELRPGDRLETESELCEMYRMSRYPVRQALGSLVKEGYLIRIRGSGTYVSANIDNKRIHRKKMILGLILFDLKNEFGKSILTGFECEAKSRGFLTTVSCMNGNLEQENISFDMMINNDVAGIVLFPSDNSEIKEKYLNLRDQGIYIGLVDRNPGISDVDYVGSDNLGGAYTAVRHLCTQGFHNVVYVTDTSDVSSVNERQDGYLKAVKDLGMNALTHINIDGDLSKSYAFQYRFIVDQLREELKGLKNYDSLGILAVNDSVALKCMEILLSDGMEIGKDVGIIGFDNIIEGAHASTPLTTIAQNGLLLGQSAALIAIDNIEGINSQIHTYHIPTQLILRRSCGEK